MLLTFMPAARGNPYVEHNNTEEENPSLWHCSSLFSVSFPDNQPLEGAPFICE